MPNSLVVDINECKSADLNTCSEYADCTDNDGSYTCACKDGFLGDGFKCDSKFYRAVICKYYICALTLNCVLRCDDI